MHHSKLFFYTKTDGGFSFNFVHNNKIKSLRPLSLFHIFINYPVNIFISLLVFMAPVFSMQLNSRAHEMQM